MRLSPQRRDLRQVTLVEDPAWRGSVTLPLNTLFECHTPIPGRDCLNIRDFPALAERFPGHEIHGFSRILLRQSVRMRETRTFARDASDRSLNHSRNNGRAIKKRQARSGLPFSCCLSRVYSFPYCPDFHCYRYCSCPCFYPCYCHSRYCRCHCCYRCHSRCYRSCRGPCSYLT